LGLPEAHGGFFKSFDIGFWMKAVMGVVDGGVG